MDRRRVFTVDPTYFPLKRMQEIINYLHANKQQYGEHPYFNLELTPLIYSLN